MQRAVPIKPPRDPYRLWRYPGESIAWVILVIVGFLLLWDAVPMRTNEYSLMFVYRAGEVFYDIVPWIAGIGAACCIVYLLLTEQAKWGPIIALAVQLGFLFYGFSNLALSGLRANLMKSTASKQDASLVGALDRREATYDAPDAGFRVADDSIRKVRIFDQLDKEKNHLSVVFINERAPRWSIEVLPVKESGAPEGVTPDGFAEFIGKKMAGKQTLLNEKRTTAVGPAQRLFFKMREENRSMEIWMTDNLMIGDKWYRVSASDLAGADPEEDRKELVRSIDSLWKALSIAPGKSSDAAKPSKSSLFSLPENLSKPSDGEELFKVPDSPNLSEPKP
jgi:uncharacterized protein YdeI (YjbR/CyaY-like superfamily)